MTARPPFRPGAGAEQLQQARVRRLAIEAAAAGASYCTLRKNVTARRFTGDVAKPMAAGTAPNPTATALADAVANAGRLGVLPGPRPTWSGR